MYYRPQSSQHRNLSIPPNYGGNAFYDRSEELIVKNSQEPSTEEDMLEESKDFALEDAQTKSTSEPTTTEAGLFKKDSFFGKLGSEELLLLAIIFLISDSDGSDDILWLLILLLFIK